MMPLPLTWVLCATCRLSKTHDVLAWGPEAKAHYDGVVAFSQTDFTEDLKKISVPLLVMQGDDDQIVPYADAGPLSAQERHAENL